MVLQGDNPAGLALICPDQCEPQAKHLTADDVCRCRHLQLRLGSERVHVHYEGVRALRSVQRCGGA